MRLVLLKNLRKKDHSKGTYVYYLMNSGKLHAYKNQDGYLCYDRDEYNNYRKQNHKGRPSKNKTQLVDLRKNKTKNKENN